MREEYEILRVVEDIKVWKKEFLLLKKFFFWIWIRIVVEYFFLDILKERYFYMVGKIKVLFYLKEGFNLFYFNNLIIFFLDLRLCNFKFFICLNFYGVLV